MLESSIGMYLNVLYVFLTWGCQNHPLARIATSFFGFWGAVDISGHSAAFKGAIFAAKK
jgi:hypothetical protein